MGTDGVSEETSSSSCRPCQGGSRNHGRERRRPFQEGRPQVTPPTTEWSKRHVPRGRAPEKRLMGQTSPSTRGRNGTKRGVDNGGRLSGIVDK